MSSDSDSDFNPRAERREVMDSGSDFPEEEDWRVSSDEEGEDRAMTDLGATATCIKSFTASNRSSQIVAREEVSSREQPTTITRLLDGNAVPSESDIENRQSEFLAGPVIQYNVSQTYNLQQFGDVTVEGTRNLNIGGTQNISSKSGPSQEEEEKPLTATQKIRKRTESRLKAWTGGMVKTQGLVRVLDKIHKGATWVTIKGSPGEGKTTVAYMALEELYTEGRQVFQVISPEEFSEVIMTSSRPVIMLDDVFGDLEFDETEWVRWKSALKLILDVKEHRSDEKTTVLSLNRGATVILTGRDYVLNSASSDMGRLSEFVTQEQYVVDMSHAVERELQEKLDIWAARVKTRGIELADNAIGQICRLKSQHGFPHVCRLFADMYLKNKEINAEDFFKSPLEFLNKTIVKFMKSTHKLTLFEEMMKGDGKVGVRDLRRFKHRAKIIQAANDLVGPYLEKEDDGYTFDHPSIYDSVAYNLCKLDPLFVIENCNLSFIYQRIRLQPPKDSSKAESRSGLVCYIPRAYTEDLATRFACEIEKRNLFYALSHTACSDEIFVQQMMLKIKLPFLQLFVLPDKKTGEHFLSLVASSKSFHVLKYIHGNFGELTTEEEKAILFGVCRFAAGEVLSYLVNSSEDIDMNAEARTTRQTPLMVASQSGDRKFVHQMMSHNADLNAQDIEGKTVFHYLCENGHVSAVEEMINKGTDINLKTRAGRSPLWFACLGNQVEMMKLLLDKGARLDSQTVNVVCRLGNIDLVKLIIDKNVTVNMISDIGETPLHVACEFGNTKLVSFLSATDSVNALVDVNAENMLGNTPLHMAAMSGSKECIDVMLKAGANVNAQNNYGYTPLHNAVGSESEECVTLLLRNGADVNVQSTDGYASLHTAAKSGSTECVNALLKAGADVNVRTKNGHTALHKASGIGCKHCVDLLLKAGANVNGGHCFQPKGTEPETVTFSTVRVFHKGNHGSVECLPVFHTGKSRPGEYIPTERYYTPLHAAAGIGSEECVDVLLKAGADTNVQTECGSTPLFKAAEKGSVECTRLLIKAGANVNAQNNYGYTPLHNAVGSESEECVTMLLRNGADVNVQSTDGYASLHTAAKSGSTECVNALLKAGADVNVRTKNGHTALHKASGIGCKHCVDLLLKAGANVNGGHGFQPNVTEPEKVACSTVRVFHKGSQGSVECLPVFHSGKPKPGVYIPTAKCYTPLHAAAGIGSEECVDVLLKAGAETNVQTEFGSTPLHKAAEKGSVECTRLLIKAGADVNVQTADGDTVLHKAARSGNTDCLGLLSGGGVTVNERNLHDHTSLHVAAQSQIDEGRCVVALILKAGGHANKQNKDGFTPLHIAARHGLPNYVNMLLKAGADLSLRTVDGLTPLHLAIFGKSKESIGLLLKAGADINSESKDGSTPLHVAAMIGSQTCYELLLTAGADVNMENKEGHTPFQEALRHHNTKIAS